MRELFKVQVIFNLNYAFLSLYIVESVEENRILNPTLAYFTTLGCAALFPLYENFSMILPQYLAEPERARDILKQLTSEEKTL